LIQADEKPFVQLQASDVVSKKMVFPKRLENYFRGLQIGKGLLFVLSFFFFVNLFNLLH